MNQKAREIRITCSGSAMVPIASFQNFQGQLKTLSEQDYKKLRKTIAKDGFSFPVFVWSNQGKNYMIDGHQRIATVMKMLNDGFKLSDGTLPVAWIEAESRSEAKKKVLLASSQYGRYTEESVFQFIQDSQINFHDVAPLLELPQINMATLEHGWFADNDFQPVTENEQTRLDQKQILICPNCGHEFTS